MLNKTPLVARAVGLLLALPVTAARGFAQVPTADPIALWPGTAPGEKGDIGKEVDTTKPDPTVTPEKYITRLGNVSKPTITLLKPPADKDTGAAVVVCPRGAY